MKKIIIIAVVLVLVVIAVIRLTTVRSENISQNTAVYSVDEVSVSIADIQVNNASFTLEYTGTLYPVKEFDIPAETAGKLKTLNIELGQRISAGSVVATIDDNLKKISYDKAKIDADKLKKDFERTSNLFKNGTSSEQELDNSRLSYESAKNKLEETEKQLSYTKVISSNSGIITKKNVELGAYVNSGTILASAVDISKLKVKLYVSEASVYYLKTGDKVKITTNVFSGKEFEGKISYISPSADASHNYLIEIELNNSNENPLKAGTFVNVSINISSNKNAMYIPREALQGSIKNAQVYVAENGKAILKNIVIGNTNNQLLEVLSGLNETDKVIVSGQVNLADGKAIKIIKNN